MMGAAGYTFHICRGGLRPFLMDREISHAGRKRDSTGFKPIGDEVGVLTTGEITHTCCAQLYVLLPVVSF